MQSNDDSMSCLTNQWEKPETETHTALFTGAASAYWHFCNRTRDTKWTEARLKHGGSFILAFAKNTGSQQLYC